MPDPNSSTRFGPTPSVDDDAAFLHSLQFLLGRQDFQILGYPSGRNFFAALPANPPSSIIVDQNIPDMTGLDIASRLRSRGATAGFATEALTLRVCELGIER